MTEKMSQSQWDELKRFHKIERDVDFHYFLMQYQPTIHLSISPNTALILRRTLQNYDAEAWEFGCVEDILKQLPR